MDLIPSTDAALKTWLVDLSGNIAISDAGVALLDAEVKSGDEPSRWWKNRLNEGDGYAKW